MTSNDTTSGTAPEQADAIETTEAYETDDGVVLYDAENPLAWIQSATTVALDDLR